MQTFTAREYLKIDISNNFGNDKMEWKDRIEWFNNNEHQLDALLNQAKEPAMFYAGVKAWKDMQAQQPIGYMISLDATSSGLQLLACLTGDRKAAELCNVVNTGTREDAYTRIYKAMLVLINEDGKIERDGVKQAIMCALYSSKAVPKQIFGEGELLSIFYDVLSEMAPAAWDLNEFMVELWQADALSHNWVLPDNFHAKVKVMGRVSERFHFRNQPMDCITAVNEPQAEGRSLGANTIHSLDGMIVREMTRRCSYDIKKVNYLYSILNKEEVEPMVGDEKLTKILWDHYLETGYLSARIIDSLDEYHLELVDISVIHELLNSLPDKPFSVIAVHDCFRCHPNYGNDLRKQYNIQLMLIAKSDILTSLISQILGKKIDKIGKLDDRMWLDVMEADYALS